MTRYLRNGFVLSGFFFLLGAGILFYTLHFPPKGVLATLFCIFLCIACFLMVPRGVWIARQLRYRHFVAHSEPFENADAAWKAFLKQDGLQSIDDPLLRKWQSLIEAHEKNIKKD